MRLSFQKMVLFLLESGDSQSSIARQMNVNPSTIHRISKGVFRPKDKLAKGLMGLYYKRVRYLKSIGATDLLREVVEHDNV